MSRLKKIAEIPAGSWTKWVVVGFWVVVLVLAFPLSKKLTGAEKNDAKYWLPGAAESTKVLNAQERFQSPNIITGVVVYERASGLTAADRAKAAADARMFAQIPGVVPGTIVGPDGGTPLLKRHGMPPHCEVRGHIDAMALYAGQSVGAVSEVRPVGDIIGELVRSAEDE